VHIFLFGRGDRVSEETKLRAAPSRLMSRRVSSCCQLAAGILHDIATAVMDRLSTFNHCRVIECTCTRADRHGKVRGAKHVERVEGERERGGGEAPRELPATWAAADKSRSRSGNAVHVGRGTHAASLHCKYSRHVRSMHDAYTYTYIRVRTYVRE